MTAWTYTVPLQVFESVLIQVSRRADLVDRLEAELAIEVTRRISGGQSQARVISRDVTVRREHGNIVISGLTPLSQMKNRKPKARIGKPRASVPWGKKPAREDAETDIHSWPSRASHGLFFQAVSSVQARSGLLVAEYA